VTTTCSATSLALGEAMAGTAPTARGWLLVEQPGAWGREALTGSRLDPGVAAHLKAGADAARIRAQTVRRPTLPGAEPASPVPSATDDGRTVVLVGTGTAPWAEVLRLDDAGLLALDPAVCAAPGPPSLGEPVEGPLVVVCTHASRDRCCATLGRPIASSLAALHGDAVWETSHLGGHRFAPTLAVLPTGHVYGRLDVATAAAVVQAHDRDRCVPGLLRGRSGLPRAAQAAEVHVRTELGLDHLDAVTDVAVIDLPEDDEAPVTVTLRAAGRRLLAQLVSRPSGTARRLSCDADTEEDPPAFELVHLGEG
jgi:(2Fe-2S) ferredoxin